MMWRHAEPLMAGAGAVYLYFDTESMQNIIQALYIPNHERQKTSNRTRVTAHQDSGAYKGEDF